MIILQQIVRLHYLWVSALSKDFELILQELLIGLTVIDQLLIHYFNGILLLLFLFLRYDLTFQSFFNGAVSVFIDLWTILGHLGARPDCSECAIAKDVHVLVADLVVILDFVHKLELFDFPWLLFSLFFGSF